MLNRGNCNNIKMILLCLPNQFLLFSIGLSGVPVFHAEIPMFGTNLIRDTMPYPICLPKRVANPLMGFQLLSACGENVAYFSNGPLCLKPKRGSFYPTRRPMQYEYCHSNCSFCYIC